MLIRLYYRYCKSIYSNKIKIDNSSIEGMDARAARVDSPVHTIDFGVEIISNEIQPHDLR
jgi:hypothetical protein